MPWEVRTNLLSNTPADFVAVNQKHTSDIVWADHVTTETIADGIAAHAGFTQPFLIRTADCLPLVLITPDVTVALHVSRKSLIAGLLDNVTSFFDTTAVTKVYIGPHICADHLVFEHRGEEVARFVEQYPFASQQSAAGLHLSLAKVVDMYLKQWGVGAAVVVRDGRCTFETVELPSYRRSRKDGTRHADHIATIVLNA